MNETTTTYQTTLAETRREIAEMEARLARLRRTEKALEELTNFPTSTSRLVLPVDLGADKKRAPKYFMEDTLLKKVFADGKWLSNADVRAALQALKYPFLVDNHRLRKTIARLAKAGQLQTKHDREFVFFALAKKK